MDRGHCLKIQALEVETFEGALDLVPEAAILGMPCPSCAVAIPGTLSCFFQDNDAFSWCSKCSLMSCLEKGRTVVRWVLGGTEIIEVLWRVAGQLPPVEIRVWWFVVIK